jgi:hypothetical protein
MSKFRKHHTTAAKLTPSQVFEMRKEYVAGATQGALARKYQVSIGQVGRIVRGEAWIEYSQPEDPSELEHNRGLLAGRDLEAEAQASAERLMAMMAQSETVSTPQVQERFSPELAKRLRGYGAKVQDDEPTGEGLSKLASEVEGYTEEQAETAEKELEAFLQETQK